MHTDNNNYLHIKPAQMRAKARIGSLTVNAILIVSFIASAAYWYALSAQASSSEVSGIWAALLWSIVAVGVVTEIVKKITLSTFRNKSIWLGATFVSVLTVMGTFSILDANRESGLIKQSDQYKNAQARQESALNNASKYAWAAGFSLSQLERDLNKVVTDREARKIKYQAYLSAKKIVQEKIDAKRAYDSSLSMQALASNAINKDGAGSTSSNPLLSNIAAVSGIGADVLKTGFYLAVTLLLEFSAFWIGGRVEEIKNHLAMTRAQLLDLQNIEVFGISVAELSQLQGTLNPPGAGHQVDNEGKKHFFGFVNTDSTPKKKPVESKHTEESYSVGNIPSNKKGSVITECYEMLRMRKLHAVAKNASNNTRIKCPVCEAEHLKKMGRIFCSNKGAGNCADEYKNILKPSRLDALANKRRKQGVKK